MPQPHPTAPQAAFVHVDVEPGPASEDGVTMRFKRAVDRAGEPEGALVVHHVPYESEAGLAGDWTVRAALDSDGTQFGDANAFLVEDSSDGLAWLVAGGPHGLVLVHGGTGTRVHEPYLLLSKTVKLDAGR
jgi:hypothetical protein